MDWKEQERVRAVMRWWRTQNPTCNYVLVRNGFIHAIDMATQTKVMRLYADVEKEYGEQA